MSGGIERPRVKSSNKYKGDRDEDEHELEGDRERVQGQSGERGEREKTCVLGLSYLLGIGRA